MTARTPQQMRELAEGLAAANTENHRSGQHIPAVADRAVAALRAAADQLDHYERDHNLITREWHEAQMAADADDLDRLRAVIENAPHGRACRWLYSTSHPCTCWKADAL